LGEVALNELLVVAKKETRGRKKHSDVRAGVQHTINAAGPLGAQYILKILQTKMRIDFTRWKVAEFVVEQHLGKARQKIEVDSPINSYLAIIALAEKAEQAQLENKVIEGEYAIKQEEKQGTDGTAQVAQDKSATCTTI